MAEKEKLRQVASHINEETGRQPQWFILDLLTCTSKCQQLAQRIAVNYPRLDGVCIMPDCSAMFAQ